jgi:hypothetical protein
VKAGPQTIIVTFLKKTAADVDDLVQRFDATTADLQTGVQFGYTTVPHLSGVEILGPYNILGPGNTASRARTFTCRPASASEETVCAKKIIAGLTRHAFRRPVTDADLEPLMNFYRSGRQGGSFDRGIEMALRRILADPSLFPLRSPRSRQCPCRLCASPSDIELAYAVVVLFVEQHSG